MRCPACQEATLERFFEMPGVPVFANVLWDDAETARSAPRGDIRLAVCPGCALLYNEAFEAERVAYSPAYENSLHYSPHFQRWAEALAKRLVETYELAGRTVLEIGCGKGDFLRLLHEAGCARGVGFDASFDPAVHEALPEGIQFVSEPFSEAGAGVAADLVCSRHVLEHVPEPAGFLAAVRGAAEAGPAVVYFEVPNALYTLRDLGIWDLIYEHCSYFSPVTLARLFRSAGFDVLQVAPDYGEQFLAVEARPGRGEGADAAPPVEEIRELATRFARAFAEKTALWNETLEKQRNAGAGVALWGSGSKGVTFLNVVPEAAHVALAVDMNPRKQGRFIPGTGQPVVAPEQLREERIETVLVMNPLYADEIRGTLRDLDLDAEVRVV